MLYIIVFNFCKQLVLVFTLFICSICNIQGQIDKEIHNILSIDNNNNNNNTTSNNLPELIKTKAKNSGYYLEVDVIATPNYSIYNHWKKGEVQKLIQSKKYYLVILQKGPSSQLKSKSTLIDYGKKFNEICKENNTLLAYFMVWPSLRYYDTFNDVIKNYELAAKTNNAILFPVGRVWKTYFDTSKKFDYYDSDSVMLSIKGSKIAASVITKILIKHLK